MLRNEYERIIIEHNSNKMTINSKLGELMQIKDTMNTKNMSYEETFNQDTDKKREKVSFNPIKNINFNNLKFLFSTLFSISLKLIELSRILWGIDNLADKCLESNKYGKKSVETLSLEEKLECIQVRKTYLNNLKIQLINFVLIIQEFVNKKSEVVKSIRDQKFF